MILTYAKYIELLTALDEHTKCKFKRKTLQNYIFHHLMSKYGYFVAENINGIKMAIWDSFNKKVFRNHMNQQKIKKKKKKKNGNRKHETNTKAQRVT